MSLKSIEMQVALPRSVDASKLHEQLSQRGQHMNDHAVLRMKQEEMKLRETVMKQEQKENANLHLNGENSKDNRENRKKEEKANKHASKKSVEKHPYKGNFLDFSG